MSLLCALFGHKPGTGYYHRDGDGYLVVEQGPVDGLNTEHARVFSKCDRCGAWFKVGNEKLLMTLTDRTRRLSLQIAEVAGQRDRLLDVCRELAESAAYWSEYDVPLGIVDQLNDAIAATEDGDGPWINPNDKTQGRYLPDIGEPVLFCHDGKTYYGKHTGGCFKASTPPFRIFDTWECRWMYPPRAHQ
jgi:hypothetical protein